MEPGPVDPALLVSLVLATSLVLFGGPAVRAAPAQEAPDSAVSTRARLLLGLKEGVIRLHTAERGDPYEGTLVGVDRSDAVLDLGGRAVPVPLQDVESIWVYEQKAGKGALIGGLVLGSAGGLFTGWLFSGLCDAADCSGAWADGAVLGFAVGGAVGAVVGGLFGLAASDWEPVFP